MAVLIGEDGAFCWELADGEGGVGRGDRALAKIGGGAVPTIISKKFLNTHDAGCLVTLGRCDVLRKSVGFRL